MQTSSQQDLDQLWLCFFSPRLLSRSAPCVVIVEYGEENVFWERYPADRQVLGIQVLLSFSLLHPFITLLRHLPVCDCWSVIAGSPSRIASCKLRPGCCAFTREVIFVGGACVCLIAAGAHAQASPPLPEQRLLTEQPRLAEGRGRKRGVKGGKSGWMWLRGRRSRHWTFKEAMLLNVSQTMNKNIPVQVWIILWNLGPREFGIALHQDCGYWCMYGITHELISFFHHVQEFFDWWWQLF